MKRKADGIRGAGRSPEGKGARTDHRQAAPAGRSAGAGQQAGSPRGRSKRSGQDSAEARRPRVSNPRGRADTTTAGADTMVQAVPQISQDEAIMRRVAGGDEAAVAELYDRFASLVYRMSHQVLSNRGELEDVMQEVFVILWRTAARYDPSRAALVTWVMLITRRRLVDRLRRRHRMDEWARDATQPQVAACDAMLEQDDEFERVMTRVQTLPELQRVVLTRVYLHGQTLRQIGEHLRTPLGTIKTALNRGLNRLRAEVSEGLPPEILPTHPRRSRRALPTLPEAVPEELPDPTTADEP